MKKIWEKNQIINVFELDFHVFSFNVSIRLLCNWIGMFVGLKIEKG